MTGKQRYRAQDLWRQLCPLFSERTERSAPPFAILPKGSLRLIEIALQDYSRAVVQWMGDGR